MNSMTSMREMWQSRRPTTLSSSSVGDLVSTTPSKTRSLSTGRKGRPSSSSKNGTSGKSRRKGRRPGRQATSYDDDEADDDDNSEYKQTHNLNSHNDHNDDDDDDDDVAYEYDEETIVEGRPHTQDENDEEYIEEVVTDDDHVDDDTSVYTTITVETTRTKENENKKPLVSSIFGTGWGGITGGSTKNKKNKEKKNTQVLVTNNTSDKDPKPADILKEACNDITKLTIHLKQVTVDEEVAHHFLTLMRGDNRSWEAIAVDILRQKARWDAIVLEECTEAVVWNSWSHNTNSHGDSSNKEGTTAATASVGGGGGRSTAPSKMTETMSFLDLILSHILCVDDCAFLHLSNHSWTMQTAWSMQALAFSKSLHKLQLDLIDLNTFAVPMLIRGLRHNTSIQTLITSRCGLQDDKLGDLLGNLPKQLEELRIFGNKCRTKGLASLTKALSQKDTKLRHLDLSYQHVNPEEAANKDFDLKPFSEVLRKNKTLKVLDLDNNSIDDEQVGHIIEALCKNRTLEELMLNHNRIAGGGVALLAAKMNQMKGLKKISMYSNVFDSPEANASKGTNSTKKESKSSSKPTPSKEENDDTSSRRKNSTKGGESEGKSVGSPKKKKDKSSKAKGSSIEKENQFNGELDLEVNVQ